MTLPTLRVRSEELRPIALEEVAAWVRISPQARIASAAVQHAGILPAWQGTGIQMLQHLHHRPLDILSRIVLGKDTVLRQDINIEDFPAHRMRGELGQRHEVPRWL